MSTARVHAWVALRFEVAVPSAVEAPPLHPWPPPPNRRPALWLTLCRLVIARPSAGVTGAPHSSGADDARLGEWRASDRAKRGNTRGHTVDACEADSIPAHAAPWCGDFFLRPGVAA